MKLIVSSSNKDKIDEIKKILSDDYELILKSDIGLDDIEVKETGNTLKENAYLKAKSIYDKTKQNVIADDSGLFVEALDFKPGVHTARYAGENAKYEDNNKKLLEELKDVKELQDRYAYFMTSICLITESGEEIYSEGKLEGYIAFEEKGDNKFGYNPIFIVKNINKTLAELSDEERITINHRKKALEKLKFILEEQRR